MSDFGEIINVVFQETIVKGLNIVSSAIPEEYRVYINLGLILIAITLYGIFVWNFYRFLAKRDLLDLNLNQYNKTNDPSFYKLLATLLFILEYIIILPVVVFFWFVIMASLIFVLAEDLQNDPSTILLISTGIIGAVRITAYYNEDLSKDIAKTFPFTLLAIALTAPGFFKFDTIRSIGHLGDLLPNIFVYLLVVIIVEFILRMLYLVSPKAKNKEKA